MNDAPSTGTTVAQTTQAEPEVSPIPPALWWALFLPTFAVVVFGMQRLLSPRVPLRELHRDDDPE